MRGAARSLRSRIQVAAAAAALLGPGTAAAGGTPSPAQIEAGRLLYEGGVLPDGRPLRAVRPEGLVLEGEHAACASCHRRSGMGSVEGSIDRTLLVPPVAGPVLFQPSRFHGTYLDSAHHWVPNPRWERALTRGAYDDAALARALREGRDPDAKPLLAPMPRYDLDAAALSALGAYLRTLATRPAPGVEPATLELATVVTPDAPRAQAESMLAVLRAWSRSSRASGSRWRLQVWEPTGPPETWQAQLLARYRERPIFALLSGAGGPEWGPVHRFCEEQRVPCVLPSTEVAPADAEGFYSVYFSPGVPLEARVLARFLAGAGGPGRVEQVVSDATGRRAASTLARSLAASGVTLGETAAFRLTAPGSALAGLSSEDALVLWLRPHEIEALAAAAPAGPGAGRVFLSALLAPPGSTALPPAWRTRAIWVSLFDDLGIQGQLAKLRLKQWLGQAGLSGDGDLRVQGDAYAAAYFFASALAEIRGQEVRRPPVPLGREHLLEVLETEVEKYSDGTQRVDPDAHVAYYGRMSLGPGQRTAVRGGILLRHASPGSDELVPVGARIVP